MVRPLPDSALTMMTDSITSAATINLNSPTARPIMATSVEAILQGPPTAPYSTETRVYAIVQRPTAFVRERVTKYIPEQDVLMLGVVAAIRAHAVMHGLTQTHFKVSTRLAFQCPPICIETRVSSIRHTSLKSIKQSVGPGQSCSCLRTIPSQLLIVECFSFWTWNVVDVLTYPAKLEVEVSEKNTSDAILVVTHLFLLLGVSIYNLDKKPCCRYCFSPRYHLQYAGGCVRVIPRPLPSFFWVSSFILPRIGPFCSQAAVHAFSLTEWVPCGFPLA